MNCPKCGAPVEPGDRFCEVCGSPIQSGSSAPAGNPSPVPPVGNQNSVPPVGNPVPPTGGAAVPPQGPTLNTKRIRKWFQVKNAKWPLVISLLGLALVVYGRVQRELTYNTSGGGMMVFGVLLVIAGIVLFFYLIIQRNSVGQAEVDAAWDYQTKVLTGRALQKLDLIDEQANLIDPVVTIGYGVSPDETFRISKAAAKTKRGLLRALFGTFFGTLFAWLFKDGTELDPYEAYRIGDDDCVRSMLLQVNTFRFTETQVLVYTANVDISTGLIYSEETSEVFYEDIEGIEFVQELFKAYNRRRRKYINRKRENMKLYLGGCNLSASINMNADDSYIDSHKQFAAMRNLIREKKA